MTVWTPEPALREENNLPLHIATLRKVLCDDRQLISTVHGDHARDNARARAVLPTEEIAALASNAWQAALPAADGKLCGRDVALHEMLPLLQRSLSGRARQHVGIAAFRYFIHEGIAADRSHLNSRAGTCGVSALTFFRQRSKLL